MKATRLRAAGTKSGNKQTHRTGGAIPHKIRPTSADAPRDPRQLPSAERASRISSPRASARALQSGLRLLGSRNHLLFRHRDLVEPAIDDCALRAELQPPPGLLDRHPFDHILIAVPVPPAGFPSSFIFICSSVLVHESQKLKTDFASAYFLL